MKNSPIRWVGGKSRLRKTILERIPEHQCYVEVFGGAAWVLFAKEPSPAEVYNDVDGELVNLFRIIQRRPEEFLEAFKLMLHSRQTFDSFIATDPYWLDEVTRAIRYYYLIKSSFGGRMVHYGTATTRRRFINMESIRETVYGAHQRLEHVQVEQLTYELCLERYDRPHTFLYLDPPYWEDEAYRYKLGTGRHQDLREHLAALDGRWLLSYNNHPEVRRMYKGFRIEEVKTMYQLGSKVGRAKPVKELLIRNY
ncbi:DNA adenine methylase [Nitrospinae bacterium AH_259_B05_G02_I21]|nr:DNA adenine methylase [Nitrospinae bacterium AH_259_B05_G02_I21]